MITKQKAIEITQQKINKININNETDPWIVLLDETIEEDFGFVLFYQSKKYIETDNITHALVGNAPFIIDKFTGKISETGTAQPIQYYIDNYKTSKNSMETFFIEISYNQLAIFNSSLIDPFNDWTDLHIAQGFTWRTNSVSFEIIENGPLEIKILNATSYNEDSKAIRIIRLPFIISDNNIEIASISDSKNFIFESDTYCIYFSLFLDNKCEICFIKESNTPKILKMIDKPIPDKLLMDASPA